MSLYFSTGLDPAGSAKGLAGLTRSPLPSPWIVGRAEDWATDEAKPRRAMGTADARTLEVAFLAETARSSELETSDRADMLCTLQETVPRWSVSGTVQKDGGGDVVAERWRMSNCTECAWADDKLAAYSHTTHTGRVRSQSQSSRQASAPRLELRKCNILVILSA